MKNMQFRLLILGILVSFIISCNAQKSCNNCGMVISGLKFLDTISQQYVSAQIYWPDMRIWYKDSLAIEEITYLYISKDSLGREIRTLKTDHYTFVDLRSRSFYDYSTFSDTAKFVKKYTQPDSVTIFGGWNFYASRIIPVTEPPKDISDTIIEGINYQRVKFINRREGVSNPVLIAYLRCDKKGTLFQIDKEFGDKKGCPIVRYEELPTDKNPFANAGEILFVADTLSQEELKVFAAWEKNAKDNPVK